MANANSTVRNDIKTPLDALDSLNHAVKMTNFLQDVLTLNADEGLPENLDSSGLYFIFNDIKDRIIAANKMLDNNLKTNSVSDSAGSNDIKVFFDEIFLSLGGLKEHASHSQVDQSDIESVERVVSNARTSILGVLG